jgi:hypothetical protein
MGYEGGVRGVAFISDLSPERHYLPINKSFSGLSHISFTSFSFFQARTILRWTSWIAIMITSTDCAWCFFCCLPIMRLSMSSDTPSSDANDVALCTSVKNAQGLDAHAARIRWTIKCHGSS